MFHNNKFYYTTFKTGNMEINRRKKPLSPKRKQETPEEKVRRRRARQNRRYHAMKAQRKPTENLKFVVEGDLSPEDIDSLLADAGLNEHVAKPEPVPKRVYIKKRPSFVEVLKRCSKQYHAGKMSILFKKVMSEEWTYKEMARLLSEEVPVTDDEATKALGPDVLRVLIV